MPDLLRAPRHWIDRLQGNGVALPGQNLLDRLRGLDFLVAVPAETHGYDPDLVYRSAPSGGRSLVRLLRSYGVTEDDSILDLGCGKGHAMRSMLKLPFARVDGLELAPALVAIARSNFTRLNAHSTRIFEGDARTFDHYEDYNFVYLYNPFPTEVMDPVVERLEASLVERPRTLTVIYANVTCESFLRSDAFDLRQRTMNRWNLPNDVYRSRG